MIDSVLLDQLSVRDSIKTFHNPKLFVQKLRSMYSEFKHSSLYSTSSIIESYTETPRADPSKHYSELFESVLEELQPISNVPEKQKSLPRIPRIIASPLKISQSLNDFKKVMPVRKMSTPSKNDLIFAGQLYILNEGEMYPVWGMIVGKSFTLFESYENQTSLIQINLDDFVQAIPKEDPSGFTIYMHSKPVLELEVDSVVMCLKWTSYITAVSCNFTLSK